MKIGVVKEIKEKENRVAVTPHGVRELVAAGNIVMVENEAGVNSGFSNDEYVKAGAKIVNMATAWAGDMVIKVKEPLEPEYKFFRDGLIIFTYFHLAGVTKTLTDALIAGKVPAIEYEAVENG